VFHREGAIWPFTVVGRPPQEDTAFGALIHELTGPVIPTVLPGVKAVHAVDATGVHPLLLAIGSERYVPYAPRSEPQELLTQAHAILGQGQLSLAKYLFIIAEQDAPGLDIHDIASFLRHVLERVDLSRDLHFQTRTTIDTLDYSGGGLNQGSKLVVAAVGERRRSLGTEVPANLWLPEGWSDPRIALPGILCVRGRSHAQAANADEGAATDVVQAARAWDQQPALAAFPLVVVVDDSAFAARSLQNFLWVTFTRSNPAADVFGAGAATVQKHWGCRGPLLIDARTKAHHAPPLIEDPAVTARVDRLFAAGGALAGIA
jgi:4-hydroxy-3-polyprenylbenzoate decarboxylase